MLLLPDGPLASVEAVPVTEKGTQVVEVVFAGALKVQLLKVLLSALFHKCQTNA